MAARRIELGIGIIPADAGFGSAAVPTEAHRRIMGHYASPLLLGPDSSPELLEMMTHMFTEEEAETARHLPPLRPRTAREVSAKTGRPVDETARILDFLALKKRVILACGDPRRYTILPIVPGTFEMALMTPDLSTRNRWHAEFARLFEKIWDEGYIVRYTRSIRPGIRYLPVHGVSGSILNACPSERMEEIIEPYSEFAVGMCQCRMAMDLVDKGCGRPLENCVVMGPGAAKFIDAGLMRRTDASEVLAIKRDAEEHGCVSWTMSDVGGVPRGNSSCSCCGCCCHAMRSISQFNFPAMISPPHFLPLLDREKCVLCGACVAACPMGAWSLAGGSLIFDSARCIGCGLCVVACKKGAMTLGEAGNFSPDAPGWLGFFLDNAPGYLSNAFRVWARRLLS